MAESQMESMAQSRRLAQEESDFKAGERERAEANRLAAAETIKGMLVERGGPNVAEDAGLEAVQWVMDATSKLAQDDANAARERGSNLSASLSEIQIRNAKIAEAAQILMGRPDFFEMAFFEEKKSISGGAGRGSRGGRPRTTMKERESGGVSEVTRRRAITDWARNNGVDPSAASIAYDALDAQRQKLQAGGNPWQGGTAKLDPATVREYADEAIDKFDGDMAAAMARMEANKVGKDAAEQRQIQQVIDEIEGRGETGFDVKVP